MAELSGAQHSHTNLGQFRSHSNFRAARRFDWASIHCTAAQRLPLPKSSSSPFFSLPSKAMDCKSTQPVNLLHIDFHLRVCILLNPTYTHWHQKNQQPVLGFWSWIMHHSLGNEDPITGG